MISRITHKKFKKALSHAGKMCELRQSVIDMAKLWADFPNLSSGVYKLQSAVDKLVAYEKTYKN